MKQILKAIWGLLKETMQAWTRDRASRWAAALAYYTIFSMTPLLVISIAVASAFVTEERAQAQAITRVESLLGLGAADAVETLLENRGEAETGLLTTIISIVTLLIGASAVFTALQDALNVMWNVPIDPEMGFLDILKKRLLSFVLVAFLGILLLVSTLISAILASFNRFLSEFGPPPARGLQVVDFIITFVMITIVLGLMFKVLPDADVSWGDVWIGAVVTSLLLGLGRFLISLYLRTAGVGSTFGAAGSFLILLVWVYYSAQIIFFGAELTQVYANKYGSRLIPWHSVES